MIKIALKAILDKHEFGHLQGLNGPKPYMIPYENELDDYLHRLDGLNFIQPWESTPGLHGITLEHKEDLKEPDRDKGASST